MKPEWLKIKRRSSDEYSQVKRTIEQHGLNTICSSGRCPNQFECWSCGTATFMILGEYCTRSCRFCATKVGKGGFIDNDEPRKLAESIRLMGVRHAVITAVTRDDLIDQGASHWVECINKVKEINPTTTIEVLIPDFNGDTQLIDLIISTHPDVIGHNIETVERLTPLVRSRATYHQSLKVLSHIASSTILTKTGLMVGLGETPQEVAQTLQDCYQAGCRSVTIGQYLQPDKQHLQVAEYIHPDTFAMYREQAIAIGYKYAVSGPLVRSSYHAEKQIN